MKETIKKLFEFAVDLVFNSPNKTTPRLRSVKAVLWFFTGAAALVAVFRFGRGLGSTTALTDTTPWGLWIGFDVLGGVALAAGGFVIAATVYIFHMEKYHPILRPAVLTAFLGYAAVIIGLLFDIGLPWNIWRPMVHWQHHSALFEVAWCVMLYFTVLAFEFAPVVLEKMPFPRLFNFFKRITLPLVILGIMLSTLHQSSLGTLFLIMPFRLHPLWYSPILPVLFFVSAVGLGLAMVTMESLVSSWVYYRKPELHLFQGLGKAAAWVLGLYAAIRLGDLIVRGQGRLLFEPSWPTALFWFELAISALIPVVLFSMPRVRKSAAGMGTAASFTVAGFVLNRIDVSGISTITVTGTRYFPSWTEFAISIGIVSGMALIFFFFVEHFHVYEEEEVSEQESKSALPWRDEVSGAYLDSSWLGESAVYSFMFVIGASLAFLFLPRDAVFGPQPRKTPVESARMVEAYTENLPGNNFASLFLVRQGEEIKGSVRDVLFLDGDNDGRFVLFDHEAHQARQRKVDKSCAACHHMNRPFDEATSCAECHRDMFLSTDLFNHDLHAEKLGGNRACRTCHADPALPKVIENTKPCLSCHQDMAVDGSFVEPDAPYLKTAPPYMDAMHGLCQECHRKEAESRPELGADFHRCGACHVETDAGFIRRLPPYPAEEKQVSGFTGEKHRALTMNRGNLKPR